MVLELASGCPHLSLFDEGVSCHHERWSLEICCPVFGDRIGVEPQRQGKPEGGRVCGWWGPGVGREKFDRVVSQGAEAFESGHTCLSCERPYSPWLAGIPEQRHRETERVDRKRPRVKRKCK